MPPLLSRPSNIRWWGVVIGAYRAVQGTLLLCLIGLGHVVWADCPPVAYVAEHGAGELSAVNLNTGAVTLVAGGLPGIFDVALNPSETTAYGVLEFSGQLRSVDLASGAVATVATGLITPRALALNRAGTTAYVSEANSGELSAVNLQTGSVTTIASGLSAPHGVVLNAAETTAYVVEANSGELSAVNLSTGSVTTIASGLSTPLGVAINPSETTAYVGLFYSGNLMAIDLATGAASVLISGLNPSVDLAVDASGNNAFVTQSSVGRVRKVELATGVVTNVAAGLSTPLGIFLVDTAPCVAAGRVPDGEGPGVISLTVERAAGGDITLSWGASCLSSDDDFEVYEGALGDFTSHLPVACSTSGATTMTFTPSADSSYYLVVPRNAGREGSYGLRSDGSEIPPSTAACLPQLVGGCS